jgi:hypothetical protein
MKQNNENINHNKVNMIFYTFSAAESYLELIICSAFKLRIGITFCLAVLSKYVHQQEKTLE